MNERNSLADEGRPVKHSLVVAGHRTSVSLEAIFWRTLHDQAQSRGVSLAALVREVDAQREGANLSSALRVHILRSAMAGRGDALHGESTSPVAENCTAPSPLGVVR